MEALVLVSRKCLHGEKSRLSLRSLRKKQSLLYSVVSEVRRTLKGVEDLFVEVMLEQQGRII